jgi:hypothetical protein
MVKVVIVIPPLCFGTLFKSPETKKAVFLPHDRRRRRLTGAFTNVTGSDASPSVTLGFYVMKAQSYVQGILPWFGRYEAPTGFSFMYPTSKGRFVDALACPWTVVREACQLNTKHGTSGFPWEMCMFAGLLFGPKWHDVSECL